MPRDAELRTAFGVEPYEDYGGVYDDDLSWREEAFGERPVLGPWGDPFHGPESDEVLECGVDECEVCESCQ